MTNDPWDEEAVEHAPQAAQNALQGTITSKPISTPTPAQNNATGGNVGAYKPIKPFADGNKRAIDIKRGEIGVLYEGVLTGRKDITTKIGRQIIWQVGDGEFYGFTNLNRCLSQVPIGTRVRFKYDGKKTINTKFGPTPSHQVTVEAVV